MGLSYKKIGIVGGSGKMGEWLAGLMKKRNLTVLTSGRSTSLSPAEMAVQCDVVVISVPIADTISLIREIGPLVHEEGVLMDLTSVKRAPMDAMLKYSRSDVVGIHPLFGPESINSEIRNIAVCPGRGKRGLGWICDLFRDEGYRVTVIGAEIHDRMMGLIQVVNHFSTIAFAMSISNSGFDLEEIMGLSTSTFTRILERIKDMLEQPADLFGSILMENPFAEEYIRRHIATMESLKGVIDSRDQKGLEGLFNEMKDFFKGLMPIRTSK